MAVTVTVMLLAYSFFFLTGPYTSHWWESLLYTKKALFFQVLGSIELHPAL